MSEHDCGVADCWTMMVGARNDDEPWLQAHAPSDRMEDKGVSWWNALTLRPMLTGTSKHQQTSSRRRPRAHSIDECTTRATHAHTNAPTKTHQKTLEKNGTNCKILFYHHGKGPKLL